jgi:hypothetical protein
MRQESWVRGEGRDHGSPHRPKALSLKNTNSSPLGVFVAGCDASVRVPADLLIHIA